ncbi:MAG: hypothetical protein A3C02_00760 [Candidatus Andersenbacteria bacterium RIFCSPHIGHO2_02_FULL_45_11]|uniref:Uncharacterized protein n=1 Tax=Candidatus Andersenbacteria bacterium RIFCSPHIGHO2_12_FULL_45_11 TaxID=1797281 RepID=A0A1G1X3U4_9BACT|nr:MAG: hypothetical protein A2805_01670 [Candidatus Andersenbacteria bacterium RIFCSPHIGHO2_01_FULL_46_36]OGY33315.1 MAG: hypothetical protein A3C02_00760 [Candidatus Andersenbacteria bacterium RIFCSPHIGHO2_02_FULL_45_11]OGY34669.1 MAG: hypothetical protein A3D99_05005 [Candidatus Andersenbacteria bacterium RIFCSPHIGHO2_12_FULL_45_11]
MLVDKILEYYGRNPAVYPGAEDKWIVVFSETLLSSYIYLPFIFALLPWVYFFIGKKQLIKKMEQYLEKRSSLLR